MENETLDHEVQYMHIHLFILQPESHSSLSSATQASISQHYMRNWASAMNNVWFIISAAVTACKTNMSVIQFVLEFMCGSQGGSCVFCTLDGMDGEGQEVESDCMATYYSHMHDVPHACSLTF